MSKSGKTGQTSGAGDTVGRGGELHQQRHGDIEAMRTNQGVVIADDQNSLRAGERGPTLLEDFVLREKITHFDHERIPERAVHARGYGAHGYFEPYASQADLTRAAFLQDPAVRTPVFVRFSTVVGSQGSADTARDVRGFAIKFYTAEGNYDLVGNNIPVFFVQDAIKFPDLVHAVKPEPDRNFPQAASAHDTFWDFVSLTPESMHMLMWVMSDRAIPRSFRMMDGFGVHTFRMINASGVATMVKFHLRPKLGASSLIWDESMKLMGADPDFHRRDLWTSIEKGMFPEWELGVQAFDEAQAASFGFDVLDPTKIIPEEIVPVRMLGRLVLDRNVDSFFAETEQVAFCPANVVPGIDLSEDPLLQGRLFSYLDTQLSRLGGPNFHEIPVNRPKCPWHNHQRAGHMRTERERGRVSYEPQSLDPHAVREDPARGYQTFPTPTHGTKVRVRSESFSDHYSQARMFWLSMTPPEQMHIVNAFAFELGKVDTLAVRRRMLGHLDIIHADLGAAVAAALGMEGQADTITPAVAPKDLPASPSLSILRRPHAKLTGRKLGILATDGADDALLEALKRGAADAGAVVEIVAPKAGGIKTSAGKQVLADHALSGAPSLLFDTVFLLTSSAGTTALLKEAPAVDFVRDAFGHLKTIGFVAEAGPLLDKAAVARDADAGVVTVLDDPAPFFASAALLRHWDREPSVRTPG